MKKIVVGCGGLMLVGMFGLSLAAILAKPKNARPIPGPQAGQPGHACYLLKVEDQKVGEGADPVKDWIITIHLCYKSTPTADDVQQAQKTEIKKVVAKWPHRDVLCLSFDGNDDMISDKITGGALCYEPDKDKRIMRMVGKDLAGRVPLED